MLTRYGRRAASSRLRSMQYQPWLESAGLEVEVAPLFSDAYVANLGKGGRGLSEIARAYARRLHTLLDVRSFDLLWIEKEALPWLPYAIENRLLRGAPYALDYDDAVFHRYDQHRSAWVRSFLGRKLDRLMAGAKLVVAGNDYLAQRALDAGATSVEVIPTVVDLDRYVVAAPVQASGRVPLIVWIGSPSTAKYLEPLVGPLGELARRIPFQLRIVGSRLDIPGVDVECLQWTEESEAKSIAGGDIGIMPLSDSPWERGKCGYKLIQYMAVGLPVVASPVGVNAAIVGDGISGFLARSAGEWVQRLEFLLTDEGLRRKMGAAGRTRVENEYCVQRLAPRLVRLLTNAACATGRSGQRAAETR